MSNIKPSTYGYGQAAFEPGPSYVGQEELLSGYSPQYGVHEDFAVPANTSFAAFEPVTISNGTIAKAAAGQPAHALTVCPIPASAEAQRAPVVRSGCFNPAALTWGSDYDTLQKKLDAFRGAPTPTTITVRARL